jgi:shikimate dehydrogenase
MAARPIHPGYMFVPMIGHPIVQVITPEPMNRYFMAADIDAAIVPMDVAPERVADFFRFVRGWNNCAGVSITMPHKQAAFTHSDTVSDRAAQAGAVNLIVRKADGTLAGDMTDGEAFVQAIEARGAKPAGSRFLLIGAGGAGAAVAHAMAEAQAAAIHIVEIDPQRRSALGDSLRTHHPNVAIADEPSDPRIIDIVFNATPLGMRPDDPLPFPVTTLADHCFVADAVTKPVVTPFIAAARARELGTLTGEEMALAQLPIQLPLWGFPYSK